MDDLALVTAHRLEVDLLADAARLVREMSREADEGLLAAGAVVLHVEDDARKARLRDFVHDKVREVLERVERRAVLADEDAEVLPVHVEDRARGRIRAVQRDGESHCGKDLAEEALCCRRHLIGEREKRYVTALTTRARRIAALTPARSLVARTGIGIAARRVVPCRTLPPRGDIAPLGLRARSIACRSTSCGGAQIGMVALGARVEAVVLTARGRTLLARRSGDGRRRRGRDLPMVRADDGTRRDADARLAFAPESEEAARRLLDHLVGDLLAAAAEFFQCCCEGILDGLARRLDDLRHYAAPFAVLSSPRYIHHCWAI